MESVANQVAPGERLVTLEDDRVVLRIRLVTALATPLRVVHQLRVEASAQQCVVRFNRPQTQFSSGFLNLLLGSRL